MLYRTPIAVLLLLLLATQVQPKKTITYVLFQNSLDPTFTHQPLACGHNCTGLSSQNQQVRRCTNVSLICSRDRDECASPVCTNPGEHGKLISASRGSPVHQRVKAWLTDPSHNALGMRRRSESPFDHHDE